MSEPTKRCNKCGNDYPATLEYFAKCSANRHGLRYACKPCEAQRQREIAPTVQARRAEKQNRIQYLADHPDEYQTKCCKACKQELPNTSEYFQPQKGARDGLSPRCRLCCSRKQMELRKSFDERHAYEDAMKLAGQRRCRACHEYKPATPDYFCRSSRDSTGLNSKCKACQTVTNVENWKLGKHVDRNRTNENAKRWRGRNPGKVRDLMRNYQKKYPEKMRLYVRRRDALKRNLPKGFTLADWQFSLDWWKGCCAYCGRPPGSLRILAMDHYIPLKSPDCPGTIPSNMLPACSKNRGCNNLKSYSDPELWVIATFGENKGRKILARIAEYFSVVRPANG